MAGGALAAGIILAVGVAGLPALGRVDAPQAYAHARDLQLVAVDHPGSAGLGGSAGGP
jgi:hypothetical protein